MEQPSILVKILHSIPHVNYTFRRVNDTFNPDSDVYLEVSTIHILLKLRAPPLPLNELAVESGALTSLQTHVGRHTPLTPN